MAPVIAVGRMLVRGGRRLLAVGRDGWVDGKMLLAGQYPLIALGIIPELHGAPPGTIEPDGEAVVIEPQDVGRRRAEPTAKDNANK
jgi:hypothetical protein